ncbi:MAG TPA: serine/threonine-protein kinase [Kofleriaceae bacterium]|nr:serine/threonine-protein kinase [Kofleriaceae bacterium]
MTATKAQARSGDTLAGKYVLQECIGAGGMGAVFLAEDRARTRRIAIKVLHPHLAGDELFARRFRAEATAATRMQHRGSAEVIDFDVAGDGPWFIAMALVPGQSLGQLLEEAALSLPRALGIFAGILDALDAAHACAVIHADIKSDNFMVEETAAGDVVTMIDFGLAQLDGVVAEPGVLAGTPEYIAPEIIRGGVPTIASDLYGAGVVLYELLTGTTPFAGGTPGQVLRRQLEAPVVPPSQHRPGGGIPAALDRIVLRVLAKDPDARFASTQALRDALATVPASPAACARGSVVSRAPAGAASRAPSRFARGSDAGGPGQQTQLRHAIARALVRGDLPEIAGGYVALAAALASEQRLGAAICELEEGLDVLTATQPPAGPEARAATDQLVASLAALYDLAGEPQKARRVFAREDARATVVERAPALPG